VLGFLAGSKAQVMAEHPKVGIIMGSISDWPTMKHAADVLTELKIPHEATEPPIGSMITPRPPRAEA
jgi:hypothetical protein